MNAPSTAGTVALVGCGRLGSASLEGWLKTGAVAAHDLIILSPSDKPAAEAARAQGARVNPPVAVL
ncbi:MAG TPA: NAD(P)-binding domain-containing protein, partial [Brevundimonas sp.]|nr:NAD(P)-binding domain-containing protein [Brevundimonas sp.]